jgi:23S rRNA (cytidine1920-2'-O)/16S rRNA (cytidine1409-2'-O)-methyltransferase
VNYGQLDMGLRRDSRVTVFERTNIRLADPAELGAPFDLIVCDLSFIGIAGLAQVFANLGQPGSVFIGLIKPQFESHHEETDRGVVTDEAVRQRVIDEVVDALESVGFEVDGVVQSSITGRKRGNVEYLVRAVLR